MRPEITRHSCIRTKRMNNNLTEEQKQIRRNKIKKTKIRRAVITSFLIMSLAVVSVIAYYMYDLYRQELVIANENKDAYDELKRKIEEGEYDKNPESEQNVRSTESDPIPETDLNETTENEIEEAVNKAVLETKEDYLSTIRSYMEEGKTLEMLENIYADNIVVPDTGKYWFLDIDTNLKLSDIDYAAIEYPVLNEDTGKYEGEAHYSDGGVTARKGGDVSKFQGDIDWNAVKNDGVEFAFIRIGFRGYESGKIVLDDKYEDNITGCNEAGIDCGVYFFTEALNESEGIEEAEFVLDNLGEHHIELPIVIDVEQSANVNKSRTKNLSKEDRTKAVIAFCERVKQAGYEPMIYGNLKSQLIMLDNTMLEDYEKWFAYYHYPLRYPYRHRIWQYTSTGKVNGISGNADINLMFY